MKKQEFDKIVKEIVQHEHLEAPSISFVNNLMSKIEREQAESLQKQNKDYKLIQPKGWVIPILIFISIFALTIFTIPETSNHISFFQELPKINWPEYHFSINNLKINGLTNILFYGSIFGASIFALSIFDQVLSKKKTTKA